MAANDWHYHANHTDAPARGSKTVALRDARRLRVNAYTAAEVQRDKRIVSSDTVSEHGIEFPLIVRCFQDCTIQKETR